MAHLRCSHRFKGEHWCLWKCLQRVVKPLHSSWCSSLLLHGHVDWWVAQPVLALVGQLIHLLFLAGFTRSNPQFWGREGIQESEKDIGVTSKGSKLELQHEHGRFRYRAVCLTLAQSFRQVCFCKGLLLGFGGKKVNPQGMKIKKTSCNRRECDFFFLIRRKVRSSQEC